MEVIVLGLTPSNLNGRKSPSIRTLNNWMNYLNIEYFCFDNVCESIEARLFNEYKIPELNNCKVIALGNEVSNFLWIKNIDHFMLPHPSPLNRKLNDMDYVKSQLNSCKLYLEGAL